jgi:hypothetical protein
VMYGDKFDCTAQQWSINVLACWWWMNEDSKEWLWRSENFRGGESGRELCLMELETEGIEQGCLLSKRG